MRQFLVGALVGATVASAMLFAVPALGGSSVQTSANSARIAKKALKIAKRADRRSRSADAKAREAIGEAGSIGYIRQVEASVVVAPGSTSLAHAEADCPEGQVVISGGFAMTGPASASARISQRIGNGWVAAFDNFYGTQGLIGRAFAYCAPGSGQ